MTLPTSAIWVKQPFNTTRRKPSVVSPRTSCQHTDEERFMLERDADKPFFLNCSIFGPHQPYLCPPPWDNLYPADEIPLPTDFHYGVADKPLFVDSPQMDWLARRDSLGWNEATYQRLLSAYYGYVSMIDEGVGQLLATLREEGLFEETLIVFSADHGEFGGQFRAFYKGLPYEASCYVPLIIRDPRASGGRRCELNTSNIDLFSTILTTAGVNPPDDIESRDLTNLVAGVNPDGTIARFGRRAINPFSFVIAANSSVELLVVMWCTNSMIWRPIHLRNEISSTMQIGAQPLMLCVRSWTRGIKNNTTRGVPE